MIADENPRHKGVFHLSLENFLSQNREKKWEAKLSSNRKLHFTSLYNVAQIATFLSKIEILAFPHLKFYFIYFNTILFNTPNIKYYILLSIHLNILILLFLLPFKSLSISPKKKSLSLTFI